MPLLSREIEAAGRIPALPTILAGLAHTTGMRTAMLARTTPETWTACAVQDHLGTGIEKGDEIDVEATICFDVMRHGRPVVVDDLDLDPSYRDHPIREMHGFRSLISVPVRLPDGAFFGTLSGFDPEPRRIDTPEIIGSVETLGQLIGFHVAAEMELARSRAMLATERDVADLREQFIAVLGHDLRNPLASVAAGARLLSRRPDQAAEIVRNMDDSIGRMAGLIDEVLDFARGRLGGGLRMETGAAVLIGPTVDHVIHELRSANPDRMIEVDLALDVPVRCDAPRIAQLVSNLLGNALTHGASDVPIVISGRCRSGWLELSVANGGSPIPPHEIERLFEPFVGGNAEGVRRGLGLGLYIAAEIARAHGATLSVESGADGTCFTLRLPISGPTVGYIEARKRPRSLQGAC